MKTYATKASAKQAINNAGLQNVPHELRIVKSIVRRATITTKSVTASARTVSKYKPVFICELDEDVTEIRNRGFEAEKAPTAAEA